MSITRVEASTRLLLSSMEEDSMEDSMEQMEHHMEHRMEDSMEHRMDLQQLNSHLMVLLPRW